MPAFADAGLRLLRGFPITLKGEMLAELEQRLKTLEYEMKILKNEIQKTLLDIQEQVLIHYYPALRTEESSPSEGHVQAIESLRSKQAKPIESPNPPAAKKITLDEAHGGADRPVQPSPAFAANGALDQAAMIKLPGGRATAPPKLAKSEPASSTSCWAAPPMSKRRGGRWGRSTLAKTIVTALLVMAGVISAVFVFNSIYPAIIQSRGAMTSMERQLDERLKSQITIIHAAKSGGNVLIWVKNVGALRVAAVEACDVFFGPEGSFAHIPYGVAGAPGLHWEYGVENGGEWNPSATLKITILNYPSLPPGRYFVQVTLPNGVSDEYFIGW